ncbi:MAG: DNA polymerase III subunit delta' [Myxococcales bacterium]|nr:DNA polymerase III subunit delta' [Myxococcales bacterium]
MKFSTIIGHQRQIEALQRALANGHVAQAYLFSGTEGCGKRRTADAFAAALNCTSDGHESCGSCPNCRAMARGEHPDLTVLAPEGRTIKIESVRDIQRRLHFTPLLGRYKVVIVDEAHTLGEAAANAMLKTLEEPSANTVFLLVTAHAHLLLDTIRSRCQSVQFHPLPLDTLAAYLASRTELGPEPARLVASMSEGSLARAIQLAEGDLLALRDEMIALCETLRGLSIAELFAESQRLSNDKDELRERLDVLRLLFRDRLLLRHGVADAQLCNLDRADRLRALEGDALAAQLRLVTETQELIERNVNPRLAVEHLLLTLKFDRTPAPIPIVR